ncbi:MAG: Smr/MutS family protein [Crocinitomicaceae bacterium]|nr:Smr/MutS family protein [Crocinitomicaceae bacterium]
MNFKEGEKVRLLSDSGDFTVIRKKKSGYFIVVDQFGFEHTVPPSDLVKIHQLDIPLSETLTNIVRVKEKVEKKHLSKSKSGKKTETPMIDLHIEELMESHRNMTNSEILLYQMQVFRGFFHQKRGEGFRKIIAIHGVGEGVLRSEIVHFLHSQENVEYHDADYTSFGGGATEIVFIGSAE